MAKKPESTPTPPRKPKDGDRIVYKLNGEPTIDYLRLVDLGFNYTVDEREGKWPVDGLGWNAKRDAWQRDNTADQTPKRLSAITKASQRDREPEAKPSKTKAKARDSKANPLKLKFVLEKDTKNAVRYKEVVVKDERPLSGTIYLQKSVFPGEPPKNLSLTFAWEE